MSRTRLAVVLAVLFSTSNMIVAQQEMDPTIWQQLGIRNVFKRINNFKDANVNKKGNNPQWETKPKLLKIADPKLLEAENPLLKIAAEAKLEEDLAPQKIKAIKYLATLGCGCNTKVEDALLKGLEDCVCEVRCETIKAIMSTTGACCSKCNGGEAGSSTCGHCCSKKIRDKLKSMTEFDEQTGCFKEPSAGVRALAEQALAACPGTNNEMIEGEGEKSADAVTETASFLAPSASTTSRRENLYFTEENASKFVVARMEKVGGEKGQLLKFAEPYRFPVSARMVVVNERGTEILSTITESTTGSASIELDDQNLLLPTGSKVWVAILPGQD